MNTYQPDESDYKISPAFTFVGSTQNNRKHPAELAPGQEFEKLTMWIGEHDVAPTWPWPSDQMVFEPTLHGLSPEFLDGAGDTGQALGVGRAGSRYVPGSPSEWWCGDWFQVGPYLVLLRPPSQIAPEGSYPHGQATGPNVFAWTSPGILDQYAFPEPADEENIHYARSQYEGVDAPVDNAFDVFYDVTTTILISGSWGVGGLVTISYTNRYYTGGGWMAAAGVGTFWWAIQMGLGAVTFDSTGVGRLDWSGDLNIPFSFRKSAWGFITAGWPVPIGGTVYFIDTGGRLFGTDGNSVDEVDGPFSAILIPELLSTFPAADVRLVFDDHDHRILAYMGPDRDNSDPQGYNWSQVVNAAFAMIDFKSGKFSYVPVAAVLDPPADGWEGQIWAVSAFSNLPLWDINTEYEVGDYVVNGDPSWVWVCLTQNTGIEPIGDEYWGSVNALPEGAQTAEPIITTGGFQLTKPEYGVHVHYVDLDIEAIDDPTGMTVLGEIKDVYDEDGTFVAGSEIFIPAVGHNIVRITFNRLINRAPQFRFTLKNLTGGKVRIWGIERIAFAEGGVRI